MIGWPKAFNKAAKNIPLTRKWVPFFIALVGSIGVTRYRGTRIEKGDFLKKSFVGCSWLVVGCHASVVSGFSFASIRVIRGLDGCFQRFFKNWSVFLRVRE